MLEFNAIPHDITTHQQKIILVDKSHIFYSYIEMSIAKLKSSIHKFEIFRGYTLKRKRKINETELLEYHYFAKGTNHPVHYGTYISSAGEQNKMPK